MNISNFIGWDIGGAHLKIANIYNNGKILSVEQYPTPLWEGLSILEDKLISVLKKIPNNEISHSVTMTAELTDIFKDREEGVKSIIKLCHKKLGKDISFYTINDGLKKINISKSNFNQIASANWHASSIFTSSLVESGLFVDVGSTTTDIIPFYKNNVISHGVNDQSRLRFNELIYMGVVRTPIMALTSKAIFNGVKQNIINENFATTADIYRILGYLNESDDLLETSDSNDKSVLNSMRRLARMLGTDLVINKNENNLRELAKYFHEIQLETLTCSIKKSLLRLPKKRNILVCAGVGHFLVEIIAKRLNMSCINFHELLDCDINSQHNSNICTAAVAIAHLDRLTKIK